MGSTIAFAPATTFFFCKFHQLVTKFKRTERAFSFCGPSVWNRLPYELRILTDIDVFKNKFKTLLKEAFEGM